MEGGLRQWRRNTTYDCWPKDEKRTNPRHAACMRHFHLCEIIDGAARVGPGSPADERTTEQARISLESGPPVDKYVRSRFLEAGAIELEPSKRTETLGKSVAFALLRVRTRTPAAPPLLPPTPLLFVYTPGARLDGQGALTAGVHWSGYSCEWSAHHDRKARALH